MLQNKDTKVATVIRKLLARCGSCCYSCWLQNHSPLPQPGSQYNQGTRSEHQHCQEYAIIGEPLMLASSGIHTCRMDGLHLATSSWLLGLHYICHGGVCLQKQRKQKCSIHPTPYLKSCTSDSNQWKPSDTQNSSCRKAGKYCLVSSPPLQAGTPARSWKRCCALINCVYHRGLPWLFGTSFSKQIYYPLLWNE